MKKPIVFLGMLLLSMVSEVDLKQLKPEKQNHHELKPIKKQHNKKDLKVDPYLQHNPQDNPSKPISIKAKKDQKVKQNHQQIKKSKDEKKQNTKSKRQKSQDDSKSLSKSEEKSFKRKENKNQANNKKDENNNQKIDQKMSSLDPKKENKGKKIIQIKDKKDEKNLKVKSQIKKNKSNRTENSEELKQKNTDKQIILLDQQQVDNNIKKSSSKKSLQKYKSVDEKNQPNRNHKNDKKDVNQKSDNNKNKIIKSPKKDIQKRTKKQENEDDEKNMTKKQKENAQELKLKSVVDKKVKKTKNKGENKHQTTKQPKNKPIQEKFNQKISNAINDDTGPIALNPKDFKQLTNKLTIIDTRPTAQDGLIKGSYWFADESIIKKWIGVVLQKDTEYLLVTERGKEKETISMFKKLGYKNIKGINGFDVKDFTGEKNIPAIKNKNEIEPQKCFNLNLKSKKECKGVTRKKQNTPNTLVIPLDELQERVDQLKGKENIVINCKDQNEAKVAYSMLAKKGIYCYVLSEGMNFQINLGTKELNGLGYTIVKY